MDGNLKELIDNWPHVGDRIVLMLGAGASYGAVNEHAIGLPNGYELRNRLWNDLKHSGANPFDPEELKLMPLEHAAAIIEAKVGRAILAKELKRHFKCDKPTWQHLVLPHLNPKAILTTNYDELVELGYAHSGRTVDVICDDRLPVEGQLPLYKPHGSLSHANQRIGKGGLVITQFDYFEFIDRYRGMLGQAMTGFNAECVISIGYSFSDMDIGAELFRLRHKNDGTPWYAVFPRDDEHVRKMYTREMKIEQVNATFAAFMKTLDEAIDFIPRHLKFDKIAQLRSDGIIQ